MFIKFCFGTVRSGFIELLREIEMLKIKSEVDEEIYDEIKYGLYDDGYNGYTVELVRIRFKDTDSYHEAFAYRNKDGDAILANGTKLSMTTGPTDGLFYYTAPIETIFDKLGKFIYNVWWYMLYAKI